jgi:hypothetical protein
MNDRITKEYAAQCFDYRDGELYWKHRPSSHFVDEWRQKIFNSRSLGKRAGTLVNGYYMVNFSSGRIAVHRLIFMMHHGFLPKIVDHINGETLDNRIENLREASHSSNLMNMKTPSSNTSGRKGVSWHKKAGKWAVGIRSNGKWKHLGLFSEFPEAVNCREKAEKDVYGEFSNGR